ncbi:hypothetical protein [Halorhabdus salina]|uniref:hypothetical protein n=1 Tax=Halorhabdus salina TaxID=2750670 RepID=UPI0015EF8933|nr:hypothetical protein [Halorhabdus salina]
MTDQQILDRALTLAEMAPHDSVSMATLAGREGRFTDLPPVNEPPITHLEGSEAPAFLLTNAKRGIGRGSKRNTVSPDGDFRTIVVVTGRRTLCLIGQQSGDETIEIPHESVAGVDYSTGFRGHRLELRTPRQAYHCWVHRKTAESTLSEAAAFIAEREPDEPEEIESEDANRIMYRGRPVRMESETEDDAQEQDRTITYRGKTVDNSS